MVAVQDAKVYMALVEAVFDLQVYCLDVDFEKLTDRCHCCGILFASHLLTLEQQSATTAVAYLLGAFFFRVHLIVPIY